MVSDPGRADPALSSLRDLVRHVGHDLNNHLASIIVNLSLASSPHAPDAERLTQVREALDAARQAAQLARQLFAAGNGSAGDGGDGGGGDDASGAGAFADLADSADLAEPAYPAPPHRPDTSDTADPAAPAAPAAAAASAHIPAAAPAPAPAAATGSLLVLEDDESVATMMKDVLKHFGYEVTVTQSPDTCVALYDRARRGPRPFDLVVLDLTIHGGPRRGIDTLAALRLLDPDVRAVAHSGDPESDIMKDPRRYGFVGAIRKPTPLAQLSRLVQSLMAGKDPSAKG